jgi:hypothetical protein
LMHVNNRMHAYRYKKKSKIGNGSIILTTV